MRLSIHTVFKLRENVLFIEEWITYHISLGFHQFYLYDNSKSTEQLGSEPGLNKYDVDFKKPTEHISEEGLKSILKNLKSKYKNTITVINWSPTDAAGNFIYGQKESILHYIQNHSHKADWTAFIDIDEFIYCAGTLKKKIKEYQAQDIASIVLLQKKFEDRFNKPNKSVTKIVNCIEGIDTSQWGPKVLLRNAYFDRNSTIDWGIHLIPVINHKLIVADPEKFRFNHYNANKNQLEWMKYHFGTTEDFSFNAKCYQLYNAVQRMKKVKQR